MRRFQFSMYIAIFLAASVMLGACSVLGGGATPTPTLPPPTAAATRTPQPTDTLTPTATATATPVPSLTPTITPTVIAELKDAKLYTSGFLNGYRYFFTVQAGQPIQGHYYAKLDNKDYTCQVNSARPDRLNCYGRLPAVNKSVDFTIYDETSGQPVMMGTINIPLF